MHHIVSVCKVIAFVIHLCADIESTDTKTLAEALAWSKKEPPPSSVADDASHERLVKVARMTEIEDLQAPRSLPYAPLCIKDPREYFDSQQANALRPLGSNDGRKARSCSLSTDDAFRHLMDQISSVKMNCPVVQSDVALKVLNELSEGISRSWRLNLKNPQDSLLGRRPHRTRDELMDHWTAIQELLCHFWSSYPMTTTVLCNKVQRLKDAMTQIYQKLQDIKESAQPDVRHEISQLVKPMTQVALDGRLPHLCLRTSPPFHRRMRCLVCGSALEMPLQRKKHVASQQNFRLHIFAILMTP
uniref:Uncharacterized protein n=1 Tax=Aegilops tauschii subsp. strangulata TaxID=200361 RepID=A0A453RXX9_AEGTS